MQKLHKKFNTKSLKITSKNHQKIIKNRCQNVKTSFFGPNDSKWALWDTLRSTPLQWFTQIDSKITKNHQKIIKNHWKLHQKIIKNVKNDKNMLKLLKVSSTDQKVGLNVPISVASLRLQNHKFGPQNHSKMTPKLIKNWEGFWKSMKFRWKWVSVRHFGV